MSSYRLLSSDSHIMEPPDLWEKKIDPAFKERAPRVVREEGFDQWYADGDVKFGIVGSNTQAGRRFENPETIQAQGLYEDVRLGGMDPHAHVVDMDEDSVAGGVIFPSMGLSIWAIPSSDLLSAVFRAYNDWLADFCAPYPRRLKGIAMLNVDSIDDAVRELKRAEKLGLAGAMIPQRPIFGRYDGAMYEPLWNAAVELDMPLTIHVGTTRWQPTSPTLFGASRGPVEFTNQEYDMKDNVTAMLCAGLFERYPNLKVGVAEYEISWAPYLLNRLDRLYVEFPSKYPVRFKNGAVPSDQFKSNMFISFQEDDLGVELRHYVGVNTLMWGSDYPHAESTFPKSREIVDRILQGVPEDERALIAGENCASVFHFN